MMRIGRVLALAVLWPTLAAAQTYTISPPPFLVAQSNSGQIISNACVWTYVAGTTTVATTYSDNAGTPNSNPIRSDSAGRFTAFLVPGNAYKFQYETSCTPPSHGSLLVTKDNIGAMPASAASVDVQGTAGESITAGQCVYLSDGSGSKTAGQWFKCDSANTYSSTQPEVGIATGAIASAATGTIRIQGQVTGLTSLSATSDYFVGTSGAVTSTAPANRRYLGHADSATSLILTGNPPPVVTNGTAGYVLTGTGASTVPTFQASAIVDDFRLSLTSGSCVTTSDVTAATTLYLTPCTGNRLTVADGSGNLTTLASAEISIAVPATTSQLYDVWAFSNSGTLTLELLAWTNDTTRATAIARTTTGFYTKSGDLTRRYVGSFRTTTVSGQTEDSATKRYVWNYYNRSRRTLYKTDATANWQYNTAAWRQARGSTANQVDIVVGVAESLLYLTASAAANNDTANQLVDVGIGEDSTAGTPTGVVGLAFSVGASASTIGLGFCTMTRVPAVGRHFYAWLEFGPGANITTWYGSGVGAQGLAGWFEG